MGDQIDEEFVRADEILAGTLKTFRDEGVRPDGAAAARPREAWTTGRTRSGCRGCPAVPGGERKKVPA